MSLTDIAIRNAKPAEKPQRLFDGLGLYLEIAPSGGKWWRFKYRVLGRDKKTNEPKQVEKRLSFGVYPEVSLKEAREKRDEARSKLRDGIDPGASRKAEKATRRTNAGNSFEAVAREWHAKFTKELSPSHAARNLRRLEAHVFPHLGNRPTMELEPPEVLGVLQRIESAGNIETAHRVKSIIGQVMRYAVVTGRAKRDPTQNLRGAIPPAPTRHHAAVTDPDALGALLRKIGGYSGQPATVAALKLAPYLFQRPGELRLAEWTEFDLDAALWEIPPTRMKRRRAGKLYGPSHSVPLPRQAVAILRELHKLTGNGKHVFPSVRGDQRPLSENTLGAAFRTMGIDSETATPHGWRATARTLGVEKLGFRAEVVEMQLSHTVKDANGNAYNRIQWLDQRRILMQAWADYLEELEARPT
jgi:integrase